MKRIFVFFTALFIFFISAITLSCSGLFSDVSENENTPSEKRVNCVSGKICRGISGAVPRELTGDDLNSFARTAIPDLGDSDIYYKVTARNTTSDSEIEAEINDEGENITFSLLLESGTYTISAAAYADSSYTEKILEASDIEKEINSNTEDLDLSVKAISESGTGSVALDVEADSAVATMIASCNYLDALENYTIDFTSSNQGTITLTDVESGSYNATFNFYDASGALIYSFTEVINIYKGLTTNTWLNSGDYVSEDKINITEDLINSFQSSSFFVKSSGNASASGGFFDPFDSITTAVTVIGNTLCKSEYTIYVLSDLSPSSNESIDFSSVNDAVSVSIESYNGASYTISAGTSSSSVITIEGNSGQKFNFTGLTFTGASSCTSPGAGMSISGEVEVTLTDCSILSNSTSSAVGGGGVYNEGTLILLGSTLINSNTASAGYGGGLYNTGTLVVGESSVIGDSSFSSTATSSSYGNYAKLHGGGVYTKGGNVYIGYTDSSTVDSTFSGGIEANYSNYQGGGIFSSGDSAIIKMSGGLIAYNGSSSEGGGVRISGDGDSFTMNGGFVQGNKANLGSTGVCGGGGIYVGGSSSGDDGVTIKNAYVKNNSAYSGGGIYSTRLVKLCGSSIVSDNSSTGEGDQGKGGGIFLNATSTSSSGTSESSSSGGSLFMSDSASVKNNTAANGGGIAAVGSCNIYIGYSSASSADSSFSGTISGNTGSYSGGGIFLGTDSENSPNCYMSSGSISNNTVNSGSGAGVHLGGGSCLNMTGGSISSNTVNTSDSASSEGGGIYIDTSASLTMEGGTISSNTAGEKGAGIYNSGEFFMYGGSISGNTDSGSTEGIGIYQAGLMYMKGAAVVAASNDLYVVEYCPVYVTGNLTGTSPVATISPAEYASSMQVLKDDEDVGSYVALNYGKFALSDAESAWHIASSGYLTGGEQTYTSWESLSTQISADTESEGFATEYKIENINDYDGNEIYISGFSQDDSVSISSDSDVSIERNSNGGLMFNVTCSTFNLGSSSASISFGDDTSVDVSSSSNYVYIISDGVANIENCVFKNMSGADAIDTNGNTSIKDCSFDSITPLRAAVKISDGTCTIESCTFTNCSDEDNNIYDIFIADSASLVLEGNISDTVIYLNNLSYADSKIVLSPYLGQISGSSAKVIISSYSASQKVFAQDDASSIDETLRSFFTVFDEDGNSYSINSDGSLSPSITVTFETDGGSSVDSQTVSSGGNAEKPDDPEKSGYFFAGWYSDEALTSEFDFDTEITESITLYAAWGTTNLYVAASGDDDNTGLWEDGALATLQKAVDKMNDYISTYSANGDWTIYISGEVSGTTSITSLAATSLTISAKDGSSSDILQGASSSGAASGLVLEISSGVTVPVTIENLSVRYGSGGIKHGGDESLSISGCCIMQNTGSGIYISGSGSTTVENTTIGGSSSDYANSASSGAGINKTGAGVLTLTNVNINNNSASSMGGGIYIADGTANISGCNIGENSASSMGGGIYLEAGSVNFSSSNVTGNSASSIGGGGIFVYGGIFNFYGGSVSDNTGGKGSGAHVYNNGTFNMSGDAQVDSSNDVFLNSGKYITLGGTLSSSLAAVITPAIYTSGKQVLAEGEGSIEDNYEKFTVTADSDNQNWIVNSSGCIEEDTTKSVSDFSESDLPESGDEVMITSADDFDLIRTWVSNGNGLSGITFKLSSSLSDSDLTFTSWAPIGNSNDYFYGTFDGNGKTVTITNAYTTSNYQAFFAGLSGAVVKNLTISGTIQGKNNCAGIAGYVSGDLTLENCNNYANVTGKSNVGGLIGEVVSGTIVITNCKNYAAITNSDSGTGTGGIAGYVSSGVTAFTMTGCYNSGTITSSGASKGALIGYLNFDGAVISSCSYSASSSGVSVGIYDKSDEDYSITTD